MSVETVHAYRFEFLKSEAWRTLRLEALVKYKSTCRFCGCESVFNDAHHVHYPKNIWKTNLNHLIILCRPCHELVHKLIPKKGTTTREDWKRFNELRDAFMTWVEHCKTSATAEHNALKGCVGKCMFCKSENSRYHINEQGMGWMPRDLKTQPICEKCVQELASMRGGDGKIVWKTLRPWMFERKRIIKMEKAKAFAMWDFCI